jgi:DNA-binding NarL/FixJ family response regulator
VSSQERAKPAELGFLICDDDDSIRMYLAAIIGAEPGFRVVGHARDGYEVVAEARRLQPQVIILDLAMPRKSGLEALPELRRVAPGATIVVLSAFAAPEVIEEAMRHGAAHYVQKGPAIAELLPMIHSVLGALPPAKEKIPAR